MHTRLNNAAIKLRDAFLIGVVYLTGVPIWHTLRYYSKYVEGVDGKTGYRYYKHITDRNGVQLYKPAGIKNILVKWKPVERPVGLVDLDIASLYPSSIDLNIHNYNEGLHNEK